jgi:hypothetical protein
VIDFLAVNIDRPGALNLDSIQFFVFDDDEIVLPYSIALDVVLGIDDVLGLRIDKFVFHWVAGLPIDCVEPDPGCEGFYDSDYGSIKKLQSLASELQIAIIVVHHTRKGGEQIDPFDKVSGSHAVDLAAHTGLRLGDLLRVSWSHVGDDAIVVTTGKSRHRREVIIPLYDALRSVLTSIPKRASTDVRTML